MSIDYEAVQNDQSTSFMYRGAILAEAVLLATTFAHAAYPPDSTGTELPIEINMLADTSIDLQEADKIMQRVWEIVDNQDMRDDDEPAPPRAVIGEFERLIRNAANLMMARMPEGQISAFFGELNITWRSGDRIVRLACFPNRPNIVQTGSLSAPIGFYQSEANPTSEVLAEALDTLLNENDLEMRPFLG